MGVGETEGEGSPLGDACFRDCAPAFAEEAEEPAKAGPGVMVVLQEGYQIIKMKFKKLPSRLSTDDALCFNRSEMR
ncbi:hypothetical protein ABTX77_27050 [Streptomyces sp. NPDC097704]|uniref:hypothetical protein n=1 Tax=Streptomyces sp. NPDC097704 TaxID=3157101 RepID=UPI00332ABB77